MPVMDDLTRRVQLMRRGDWTKATVLLMGDDVWRDFCADICATRIKDRNPDAPFILLVRSGAISFKHLRVYHVPYFPTDQIALAGCERDIMAPEKYHSEQSWREESDDA